jgi:hypothetical protein
MQSRAPVSSILAGLLVGIELLVLGSRARRSEAISQCRLNFTPQAYERRRSVMTEVATTCLFEEMVVRSRVGLLCAPSILDDSSRRCDRVKFFASFSCLGLAHSAGFCGSVAQHRFIHLLEHHRSTWELRENARITISKACRSCCLNVDDRYLRHCRRAYAMQCISPGYSKLRLSLASS